MVARTPRVTRRALDDLVSDAGEGSESSRCSRSLARLVISIHQEQHRELLGGLSKGNMLYEKVGQRKSPAIIAGDRRQTLIFRKKVYPRAQVE